MNQTYGNLYYQTLTDYPPQVLSILTRLKLYLAGKLFYENTLEDAQAKFLVGDIINGASDAGIDAAIQFFQLSNVVFPFAVYGYDMTERLDEKVTHLQRSGKYYDSTLGKYVDSKPVKMIVPYIFFFNNPKDYYNAQKIIHSFSDSLSKLDVPILIDAVTYSFSIQVKFTMERGSYSSAFQEHLRTGAIFDIVLNAEVTYNDLTTSSLNMYPVDDMILSLYKMDEENDIYNVLEGQVTAPDTPALTTTIPANGAIGVAKNTDITINFTASMEPSSVIDALSLTPYFSYTAEWNDTGTQLIITPVTNLASLTLYNIIILKSCFGFYNKEHPEEDLVFTFTTGSI